ncbi:UNVERIFIED_CONTAM: Neuronal calcium sensor 1 [Siphonaria sp. JEL0065]|nr:Neuronal calcium sensor 1 [Siphonaria sp. JEL0065]
MKECPTGSLSNAAFKDMYKQFFPFGDSTAYAERVFHMFDTDKNGSINFREFVSAISVSSKGTESEKLAWAFTLYDIDGDGVVTREEMYQVVSAIFAMVGSSVKHGADEDTPEKKVEKLFGLLDVVRLFQRVLVGFSNNPAVFQKDRDGRLSLHDFMTGAQQDPNITHALAAFNTFV